MHDQKGYVLILTIGMIAVISFAVIMLADRTMYASALATRRVNTVAAFPLAESAALEGYWRLQQQPNYRTAGERHWSDGWYRFTIVDSSPATTNDLNLEIIGEAATAGQQRKVRLFLIRANVTSQFAIDKWEEAN